MKEVLTEKEITKRFQVVFDYLCGEQIAQTKTTLANHGYTKKAFKEVKLSVPQNPFYPIDGRIDALFQVLNIQDETTKKKIIHESKDLYTFLVHLRANHEIYHLKRLISLIDNTKKKPLISWWTKSVLFLGSLLVGSSIFDFVAPERFRTVLAVIGKGYDIFKATLKSVFQVAKNFALVAIGYHAISIVLKLLHLSRSKTKSKSKKIASSLFALLTSSISIIAYALTFFAFGVATPLASGLMVSANLVTFFKAWHSLKQHQKQFNQGPKPNDPKDQTIHFGQRAAYQRSLYDYKQHRLTLRTKMLFALLSSIVVAVWCFCPPSLLLTAFSIGALLILGGLQSSLLKAFKYRSQHQLQTELDALPDAFDEVSPKLALLSKNQSEKVSVKETEKGIELQHHKLRMLLPKEGRLVDKRDSNGPYKAFMLPSFSENEHEEEERALDERFSPFSA